MLDENICDLKNGNIHIKYLWCSRGTIKICIKYQYIVAKLFVKFAILLEQAHIYKIVIY